jgi:hypothetical protein
VQWLKMLVASLQGRNESRKLHVRETNSFNKGKQRMQQVIF